MGTIHEPDLTRLMGPRVCELYLTQFMGSEPEGLERKKNALLMMQLLLSLYLFYQ